MKIQVDFYKPSGKWYSGGEVEVNCKPWDDRAKIMDEIRNNQEILIKSDLSQWTIVLDDAKGNEFSKEFWKRIIQFGER